MTPIILYEWFWHATCSCGWETTRKNEAEVCVDKVKNHLLMFHRTAAGADFGNATVTITAVQESREQGQLPATGEPVRAGEDERLRSDWPR